MNTVTTNATATATANVPTSAKLTELQAQRKLQFKALLAIEDQDSAEAEQALGEMLKTDAAIKLEKAAIKKAELDAINAEKRNQRVKLADDLIEAAKVAATAKGADKVAAEEKLTAAREVVVNELLARYAASSPAKSGAPKTEGKGAQTGEILEAHLANVAAGMDDSASRKDLEEAKGYKRSTVWHTVNNYNKSKTA